MKPPRAAAFQSSYKEKTTSRGKNTQTFYGGQKKMKTAMKWFLISGVFALVVGALIQILSPRGVRVETAAPPTPAVLNKKEAPKRQNASAIAACRAFRKVVSAVADGTATPAELRELLKPVREDAHLAELDTDAAAAPEGFEDRAVGMLRAATQDNGAEFMNAFGAFNHMCQSGL